MRRAASSLFAIVLAVSATAESQRSQVPDIIENGRPDAVPVWVSAETSLTVKGDLRSDLLESAKIREFNRRLDENAVHQHGRIESEADGCDTTTSYISPLFAPTASATDLVTGSRYVFSGSVTGLRQGFYFGSPGTLIAIRPQQWLKLEAEVVRERPVYVFFPQAKIKTARGTICSVTTPRVPIPSVGDNILIFAYTPPLGRDAAVFELRPDKQMSFAGPNGAYMPEALRRGVDTPTDLAAVVASLKAHPRIGEHPDPQKVW